MGLRGPKPKPTVLKIVSGNPGGKPLNLSEPVPTGGKPVCPEWLSKDARAEWDRIVPELERMGILASCDQNSLAAYCQACAELQIATLTIDREGRTKTNKRTGVIKPHPAVAQQRDAMGRIKQFAAEFGLSPSARSQVRVPGKGQQPDPFEDLLAGRESG